MHNYVGVIVAIISNVFIGGGIGIKKLASKRAKAHVLNHPDLRPKPDVWLYHWRLFFWQNGVVLQWMWWLGLLLLLIGECSNFYAYTIAPAFIVVLLGSVSVFTTQCIAFISGEWFNGINIFGVVMALLATTAVLTEIPHSENSLELAIPTIAARALDPFVMTLLVTDMFTACVVFGAIFVYRFHLRFQRAQNAGLKISEIPSPGIPMYPGMAVYACVGGLTVITTKAVGILFMTAIEDHIFYFDKWYVYCGVLLWFCLIAFQLYLLNALLASGDSSLVAPLLYVVYAAVSMSLAGIYFNEFARMDGLQWLLLIVSMLCIMIGVWFVTQREDRRRGCFPWCCPQYPPSERFKVHPINEERIREQVLAQMSSNGTVTPRVMLDDEEPEHQIELRELTDTESEEKADSSIP